MKIRDYNGEGDWSRDAILQRYADYCAQLGVPERDLSPMESDNGITKWVYPVMDEVIKAIELGDVAAKRIGIEFIEQDQSFMFGRILKSNTARALRRAELNEDEKARIRRRVVQMLLDGNMCREYKEYAKLLKHIGLAEYRGEIETHAGTINPYVAKYVTYLLGT